MTIKPRRFDLSPDNFIAGVSGVLDASELGVYWALCLLVYSEGGPILYDEERLKGFLRNTHLRTIRAAVDRLEKLSKITRNGSQIMVKGCETPIENALNRISKAVENGFKGGRPRKKNNEIDKPDGFDSEKLTTTSTTTTTTNNQDITEAQSASSKPKRERKDKTLLPDDFPLQADRDAALGYWREKGREDLCARLGDEVEAFRDHHRSKGTRMVDWSAAWRTWRGNALKFNAPPKGQIRVIPGVFEQTDERGWRERMRVWREKGSWIPKWGPRPNEQGCRCPAAVLGNGPGDLLGKMSA